MHPPSCACSLYYVSLKYIMLQQDCYYGISWNYLPGTLFRRLGSESWPRGKGCGIESDNSLVLCREHALSNTERLQVCGIFGSEAFLLSVQLLPKQVCLQSVWTWHTFLCWRAEKTQRHAEVQPECRQRWSEGTSVINGWQVIVACAVQGATIWIRSSERMRYQLT